MQPSSLIITHSYLPRLQSSRFQIYHDSQEAKSRRRGRDGKDGDDATGGGGRPHFCQVPAPENHLYSLSLSNLSRFRFFFFLNL
jgi:hypothetical protein